MGVFRVSPHHEGGRPGAGLCLYFAVLRNIYNIYKLIDHLLSIEISLFVSLTLRVQVCLYLTLLYSAEYKQAADQTLE